MYSDFLISWTFCILQLFVIWPESVLQQILHREKNPPLPKPVRNVYEFWYLFSSTGNLPRASSATSQYKKNHPLSNGCRVKMKMKNSTKCDTTLPDCWLRKYCFWTPWLDDFLFSFFFYFARELLWPRWVESIIKMNAMTEIGNDDDCVLLLSGEHVRH